MKHPPVVMGGKSYARRAAVAKILRTLATLTRRESKEMAAALGWPLRVYLDVLAGHVMPSEGQQNDIRALLEKARAAAAIRDELRSAPRRRMMLP